MGNLVIRKKDQDVVVEESPPSAQAVPIPQTKIYKERWLAVFLLVFYSAVSFGQWTQYSIVSNIVSRYYGVSLVAVDWTSLLFIVAYVPLVFPASYMMDKLGLRWTAIIGCFVTALGSWIKLLSVSPDRFYVTCIGQALVGGTQVLTINMPGRLAANWFGDQEVSTATSIGLFGLHLGFSGSMLFTPMVVTNHEKLEDIGSDLFKLFWFYAILSTVAFISAVLFFKEEPPLPPSESRKLQKLIKSENSEGLLPIVKKLLTNRSYCALCHSFGVNIAIMNSLVTLLNQMYLLHFKNGEKEAGQIGLLVSIMGIFSSPLLGAVLDKTKKFKSTISLVYAFSIVGHTWFVIALMFEIKWMIYASSVFLGFFVTSYIAISYDVCAEYTYPEPIDIATAFLNITNRIYCIVFVLIFEKVMDVFGELWVHVGMEVIIFTGLITTLFTRDLQRRQEQGCTEK